MNPKNKYRQLDIYWVNLDPAKGVETRKNRPCVILQSDEMNDASKSLIVAPLLPGHRDWPFVVNLLPSKQNGLDKPRNIQLKQLRGVDLSRVGRKQGTLESRYFPVIEEALATVFGLNADVLAEPG